jgi:hypothetical protein
MFVALQPLAAGFDADDLDAGVVEERMEDADRVRAAADGGDDDQIRQRPSASSICCLASMPITDWKSRTISG